MVHINPASDSMTNPDHCRVQMAGYVDFWDEIDVAGAKQTIKIVNVIFVKKEVERRWTQFSLNERRAKSIQLLSPSHTVSLFHHKIQGNILL